MYQVHSQQRPGRPRLALLGAACLLLATTAMAWLVTDRKHRALDQIALGELEEVADGALAVRPPEGWTSLDPGRLPTGVLRAWREPDDETTVPRSLYLFRGRAGELGLPSLDGKLAILEVAEQLTPELRLKINDEGHDRIGPLPAWSVQLDPYRALRGATPVFLLGKAAVAPSGEVVGLLVSLPRPIRRTDEVLLDLVAEHLEPSFARVAESLDGTMHRAGMYVDVPDDAELFDVPEPPLARLQMVGGQDEETWYLDVHRVPLLNGREPEHLVADLGLTLLEAVELPEPPVIERVNGHEVATLSLDPSQGRGILIQSVRLDGDWGLMLIGRCEPEGVDALRDACDVVVARAAFPRGSAPCNITAARAQARTWLGRITAEELASAWGGLPDDELVYAIREPGGFVLGRETQTYRRQADDWSIQIVLRPDAYPGGLREMRERWVIADDARSHRLELRSRGESRSGYQYHEYRERDDATVLRVLELDDGTERAMEMAVDDTYAPEPVLILAAGLLARAPDPRPALFRTTEVFAEDATTWLVLPLGELVVPWDPGRTARAVRVQRDYLPWPITLYYREQNVLIGATASHGRWTEIEHADAQPDVRRPDPLERAFRSAGPAAR